MKNDVLLSNNDVYLYQNTMSNNNQRTEWSATVKAAISEVQRVVLGRLCEKVAKQLVNSVNCLRESFIGTLQRCLLSLEKTYERDTCLLASDALKQILSAAYNVELHNFFTIFNIFIFRKIKFNFYVFILAMVINSHFRCSLEKKSDNRNTKFFICNKTIQNNINAIWR